MNAPGQGSGRALRREIGCFPWVLLLPGVLIIFCLAFPPMPGGIRFPHQNSAVQNARALNIALFAYANDNDGHYPDGESSTEVFQKLIEGGYVTDPTIFYLPFNGKTKADADQKKLKAENVAWDVTEGASASSPGQLPVIFVTGYKVNYAPGGAATKLPDKGFSWWFEGHYFETPGIAVGYKDNSAKFEQAASEDGTIPNFIPLDFKPDGSTYHQLTPDGGLR